MRKILSLISAFALVTTCTACSVTVSTGKDKGKTDSEVVETTEIETTEPETTEPETTESETTEPETTEPEPTDKPTEEIDDKHVVEFIDGEKFVCDEYEFKLRYTEEAGLHDYAVIINEDVSYEFGAIVLDDTHYTDLADEVCDLLEDASGVAPVLDIHDEGAYITGIEDDSLYMQFIANEHDDDKLYSINMIVGNMDSLSFDVDFVKVFNDIIDDFLASGITDNKYRTEYGEPVTEVDPDDDEDSDEPSGNYSGIDEKYADRFPKVRIPENSEHTYSSKYIQSFVTPDGSYLDFCSEPVQEYLDFLDSGKVAYPDLHSLAKYGTYETKDYGTLYIIEVQSTAVNDLYEYAILNKEGTVNIEVSSRFGDSLTSSYIESLLDVLF